MVVGEATHGPGQIDALFRNDDGEMLSSRDLAVRWDENQDVHFHPLGVLVERELYRPVTASQPSAESDAVGEPILIATYRGSTSKPWQFGLTRYNGQLLLTQARAGPAKFDPVLKRFPIETQPLGDQPLVFSHTVSRRLWSEDPVNPHVQSQRSEGLRTQFLYNDTDGWHLIQPKGLDTADDVDDDSFEPTQLDGVSVRSALLRSETDGEMKTTVEHEYRIIPKALEVCERLYALSYYEANEESLDNLQWDIAEATAYDIVEAEQ
ncbi:hypothetical protein [Halapricum desulfuricans]|uniref:hypothetical protein n=1 Tax=Halapricum desulfuricans TaxID=2841257 RepID=UPI001E28812D|nr:hypothetical protein [Halapricum desulfuricans]